MSIHDDLTRDDAREKVAQALEPMAWVRGGVARAFGESHEDAEAREQNYARRDADKVLTVLWPEVERLRRQRDDARGERAIAIAALDRVSVELDDARADLGLPPRGPGRL